MSRRLRPILVCLMISLVVFQGMAYNVPQAEAAPAYPDVIRSLQFDAYVGAVGVDVPNALDTD